jgi:hypothetical protein
MGRMVGIKSDVSKTQRNEGDKIGIISINI